jgi:predicted acetyltransferase
MAPAPFSVRAPQPHELEAFCCCVEAAFAVRMEARRREQYLAGIEGSRAFAAFDGTALVATSAAHGVELTLPGSRLVPAVVLEDVTVLPTHRRRGLLTALMRANLDAAHERGEAVVVLEASEGAIYTRFGCGVATLGSSFSIRRSRSAMIARDAGAASGDVVLIDAREAGEAFPLVFDIARRQRAGEIGRHSWSWDDLIEPQHERGDAMRFLAAHADGGLIDGYAVYEIHPAGGRREVVLEECCTTTDAGYAALFGYLCGVDLTDGLRSGPRPVDEPLRHLLADPRALETVDVRDRSWVRLVDVDAALEARCYAGAGRLVIELVDELCPWNSGRIELESGPEGIGHVARTGAAAGILCDAAALATVYLGGFRMATLCRAGRAVEAWHGAAACFDAMFYCDPLPFCTTL